MGAGMSDGSRRRKAPRLIASRTAQVYFSTVDAVALSDEVGLSLCHHDGGVAAAKILNKTANRFMRVRMLAGAQTPRMRRAWAKRLGLQAQRLLNTLGAEERIAGWYSDLDLLRRSVEGEASNARLAAQARIITRGGRHLGRVDGDPFPLSLTCIAYVREFALALDRLEAKEPPRRKGKCEGADQLVEDLATAFVSIFGKQPGVSTERGRRSGPTIRFMRKFAELLAPMVERENPETARLLKSWQSSDALGERLSDFLATKRSMGK